MFKLADPSIIGKYLSKKIDDSKYKNRRQFCKAYLEYNNEKANSDEIRKMQNRIGQIIKGSKGIQLYDLPVFCELLDVTCEELLSAGKSFVQKSDRPTNYSVAFSKDPKVWKEYINREDKLILNQDEYGNTVIDYAIKFKNYGFIKYLIDNKYIWFDGGDKKTYGITFGADTSIKKRPVHLNDNRLISELTSKDELRQEIIALAIKNKDFEILDKLRAREMPFLYLEDYFSRNAYFDSVNANNDNLIEAVAKASNKILDYFSEEFYIDDGYNDNTKKMNTFVFPLASEMINCLVKSNNAYAEVVIKKFIEHNEKTYNTLKDYIKKDIETACERYNVFHDEFEERCKQVEIHLMLQYVRFRENNIVSYYGCNRNGIVTNIIYCDAKSKKPEINSLIDKLNDYYNKIVNIKSEFIKEEE